MTIISHQLDRQPPKYERTVITTARKKPAEPAAGRSSSSSRTTCRPFARTQDEPGLARRRLAALERVTKACPCPACTDEAWRRTDIRPFKWGEVMPGAVAANGQRPATVRRPRCSSRWPAANRAVCWSTRAEPTMLDPALKRTGSYLYRLRHGRPRPRRPAEEIPGQDRSRWRRQVCGPGGHAGRHRRLSFTCRRVFRLSCHCIPVAWLQQRGRTSAALSSSSTMAASATIVHEIASPAAIGQQALHAGTLGVTVGKRRSPDLCGVAVAGRKRLELHPRARPRSPERQAGLDLLGRWVASDQELFRDRPGWRRRRRQDVGLLLWRRRTAPRPRHAAEPQRARTPPAICCSKARCATRAARCGRA